MSFLLYTVPVILLVCLVALIRGIRRYRSEHPLLPRTNHRQYSGYTEPRQYQQPVESRSTVPRSIFSSTTHHEALGVPKAFTTQSQQSPRPVPPPPLPPRPIIPIHPAVRKPQQNSLSRHELPRALVEQIHQPASKAPPVQKKVVEPPVKPLEPIYPSVPELPFAARKPHLYSFARNDLPGPSVEQVHQTAIIPPVQPCIKPVEPVYQSVSELLVPRPLVSPRLPERTVPSWRLSPLQVFQSSGFPVEAVNQNVADDDDDDDDELETQDLDHVTLRELAKQEFANMKKCRKEEKSARRHGRLMEARKFASKAQQHGRHMRILNDRASEVIFAKNNKDPTLRKIDLHGLTVKEAIGHTDLALKQARERGNSKMRIIVGKGLRSKDGNPKVKPAIQAFLEKHQFPVEVDPRNTGALDVRLDSAFSS